MKPRAPQLTKNPQPSLDTELARLCEARATETRRTIPAPPSEEELRGATPWPLETLPPSNGPVTTPAPPPSTSDVVPASHPRDGDSVHAMRPAIPPPPRVPKIAGG